MKNDSNEQDFELLKKYGARWAVLMAMYLDTKEKTELSKDLYDKLERLRIEINSGCYSNCAVGCLMDEVEGKLVSASASLDHETPNKWLDLLAQAMKGELDHEAISKIPALKPVLASCAFLRCTCQD